MNKIFSSVDNFFGSLQNYFTYNEVFITFIALFLLTVIIVLIATSHSYEAKLVKAIDMLNSYFVDNPKITGDNLVAFNQKMRHRKIPKQLRKQWQQFVLYREEKASHYMSFENCVDIPLRNSRFKRDKITMNLLAYVFAACSLVLNCYLTYESEFSTVLQRVLLAPVLILLVNYIVTIFLDLKESAIISDLYQNYQYFEVNIDKATKTLPEYVDYEILFEKNEIKKGIPILYAYLQKRAEEEQRELEKARLKNVEHEKFNFDEAGLAGSLVLERAMHEAENYIAERKKYNQDIEQINSEITQEDMNYREITKEYNRQMQVSKETFANFKQQLEEADSTIQANYLKKQQQQELDRQRNLERDFDTATERHKNVIDSYQKELDTVDKFIAQSREALQKAMMSEFSTYNVKVYDEVKKVVEEREQEKYDKIKQEIKDLEEKLHSKNKELESLYSHNSTLTDKLEELNVPVEEYRPETPVQSENSQPAYQPTESYTSNVESEEQPSYENVEETNAEQTENVEQQYQSYADFKQQNGYDSYDQSESQNEDLGENQQDTYDWPNNENDNTQTQVVEETEGDDEENPQDGLFEWFTEDEEQTEETDSNESVEEKSDEEKPEGEDDGFSWLNNLTQESTVQTDESEDKNSGEENNLSKEEKTETVEEPAKEVVEQPVKKKAGRPRKVVDESETKPKRKPGRPRKEKVDEPVKKKPGRPRKEKSEDETKKRKPGRPKKTEQVSSETKKKPGRPKKFTTAKAEKKGKRGRPKKSNAEKTVVKKRVGRPKKVASAVETIVKKRGRPRKMNPNDSVDVDIEAYLRVIDNAIAKENAKLKRTQKALEDRADIKTKKKK